MTQNLKRNWRVNSKLTWVIWWILSRALENLKNLNFNKLLLTKVYNVWAKKKYRGVIFDCTADWWKIWGQTDLYFLKWPEEFGKLSPEHVWKSKIWVFSWVLLSKVENMWAWNLQGSYVSWEWRMTQNLKRNWLANSKLTWVIWWILSQALENLENLHFNGLVLTILYNVWAKKVQRSYIWLHWRLMQNLKENWLVISQMTWRILQIFVHQLKNRFHFRK